MGLWADQLEELGGRRVSALLRLLCIAQAAWVITRLFRA